MAEPTDMILPMLRDIRAEVAASREHVDQRFDVIEAAQKSYKSALTADTLMSRLLTGEFEERIASLERQVNDMMAGRS